MTALVAAGERDGAEVGDGKVGRRDVGRCVELCQDRGAQGEVGDRGEDAAVGGGAVAEAVVGGEAERDGTLGHLVDLEAE